MAKLALQGSNVFSTTFASISGAQNSGWIYIANNNPIFNIGGESFTIECWLKPTGNYGAENIFFRKAQGVTAVTSYQGSLYTNGLISWYNGGGNTNGTRVTPNVWSHVAFVFNQGANVRIFLNGVNVATNTSVTSISNTDSSFTLGSAYNNSPYQYFGDMSNFRIIKGQAIYSGESFNVSTLPMQLPNNAIGPHASGANVASSLTGNVIFLTCNDQYLKTNGNTTALNAFSTWGDVNFHAIDPKEMQNFSYYYPGNTAGSSGQNGTVLVTSTTNSLNLNGDFTIETWYYPINSSPFPPSSNGSVLFNGTNQYLTVPSTSAFAFGTGNLTIEAWVYTTSSRGGGVTQDKFIFGSFGLTPATVFFITNDSNAPALWDGTTQWTANSSIPSNKWTHIAFTRSGTSANFYIDGRLDRTLSSFTTNFTGTAATYIGGSGSTSDRYFPGAISNLRVVNGVAVYTGNFTVPTSPLTTTQSSSTNIAAISGSQTVLLACQNQSGSTFTDSSSNNFSITGTNTPLNQNIPVSTGVVLERGLGGVGGNNASYIIVWDGQNNQLNFASSNANGNTYSVGSLTGAAGNIGNPTINAWNHIAVSHTGTTWRGFLNGNLNLTITNNANVPYAALGRGVTIGGMFNAGQTYATGIPSNTISGYISNMRIIRGNSVYNAAFTPSNTSQLGNVTNTVLLTGLTPTFEDLSGVHTLATNGMSQIGISTLSPILGPSVLNTDAANSSIVSTQGQGIKVGRIYDKFDYNAFGIQAVIPISAGIKVGRIYDKFDYNTFGVQAVIQPTAGIKVGRIYDKFDYNTFGVQAVIQPTAGIKVGRIYDKFDTDNFAYIPTGGSSVAPNYQFWS